MRVYKQADLKVAVKVLQLEKEVVEKMAELMGVFAAE